MRETAHRTAVRVVEHRLGASLDGSGVRVSKNVPFLKELNMELDSRTEMKVWHTNSTILV